MADGVAIGTPARSDAPTRERSTGAHVTPARAGELTLTALMLLPGALIVYMGFNAGGYFPATPAVAALVLAQILLIRIMRSPHPFEGLARGTLVAIAALGLYALLILLSALWSHSTSRALIEFDRAWLYLVILLLLGSVRPSTQNLRWLVRGLALGAAIVCVAGLITRVLPDVWHTAPGVSNERLSYPVTYWNALGLLAAMGIVLTFHLACTLAERRLVRVVAAAVLPLLAATLFFTFSRGAIAAAAIGLLVYVAFARPSGLLSGAIAIAPPTAVLVVVAYHANLLDTVNPTTPAAVSQGHRVALAGALCAAACAALRLLLAKLLDSRLRGSLGGLRMSPAARGLAVAGALAVIVFAGLALNAPHGLAHDWHRFVSGAGPGGGSSDLRQRLTDPANDGRIDLWRVALHGFSASPLDGHGAGMYQTLWDRSRPSFKYTINAHSLYLQAMAELGIPGLALLVILVGSIAIGLGLRARGARRSLYGALLAAGAVWGLHAGVDWDWEMPVVTLPFFAAAGAALSPTRGSGPGWVPASSGRMLLSLLCLITVAAPLVIIGSQSRLGDAEHALYASNECKAASSAALSSIGWLDVRPQPYEIVGFCDLQRGLPRLGISAMRQAVRRDPGSWETYYALAIAQAAAGIDPRPDAERALRMNPLEPLTQQEVAQFRSSNPTEWVNRSATVRAAALASTDLSIVPS